MSIVPLAKMVEFYVHITTGLDIPEHMTRKSNDFNSGIIFQIKPLGTSDDERG